MLVNRGLRCGERGGQQWCARSRVPLWIGAFFLVIAGLELLNVRWSEREALRGVPGDRAAEPVVLLEPGEFGEFAWRGESTPCLVWLRSPRIRS